MNVVKEILRANAGRDPQRLALKLRRMRADAFVFLRGSCHLFHARLPLESVLRKAPAAWACGDLHLENFGSYKGDNRQVYFDINDFDEAGLAPATWDLLRLLASVLVGRRSLALARPREAEALRLCGVAIAAYAQALADGKARWVERETADPPVRELLQSVRNRERVPFLDSRTELRGRRRLLRIDDQRASAATPAERARVEAFFAAFAATQPDPHFFEIVDVARRIAGNGSLGLPRFVVLVRGKGAPDGHYLLDLKAAPPSSLVRRSPLPQPAWADEAARIVGLQRRLQAVSMAFLHPVVFDGAPFVLRALQPSEDRVVLGSVRSEDARENLVGVMGQCLAWAQLRAGGREGAADADALIAFGRNPKWPPRLLDFARAAARQVEADWAVYARAYDDGAFADATGAPGPAAA